MARKKKRRTFSAAKTVKAIARETIGTVPPTRSVPDRKKKSTAEKHKPTLSQLLNESDQP
jgi:hypothetical protein